MQNFEHVWIATRFVKFIAERLILDLEPTGKFDAVTVPVALRKKSMWRRSSAASGWRCFRSWFLVWFRTGTRTARLLSQQYNRKTRPVMLVMSITTASSFNFFSPSIVGALSESDDMNFIPSMCLGVDAETGTVFPGNGDCTSACSSTCYAGFRAAHRHAQSRVVTGRMPWQTIFSVTLQGKEKSSGMSITSHPFPEQSRGVQTQIMFVKYVALHIYSSLSSSRRMARIVMDSGEGMWDKRVAARLGRTCVNHSMGDRHKTW